MSSGIKILLDNYSGVCYPGQTLAGKVSCYFHNEKKVRAIRIRFKGRAKVRWSESRGSGKNRRTVHFTSEQVFFSAEYNLIEPPAGEDDFIIPAGSHTYPFSFILPLDLSSSFQKQYGNIKYSIKATADRPWKIDYEEILYLNLVSLLDLNYLPEYKRPVTLSNDKMVSGCCSNSGPVTFNVSLPVTGYAPGQDVNIGAYVENLSNLSAQGVKFKIVRQMEFIAHSPRTKSRHISEDVAICLDGVIGAHGEKSWTAILWIPVEGEYPNTLACHIININYVLKASVILPFPHTNLKLNVPLMIGNIPISGVNISAPNAPPPTPPNQTTSLLPPNLNPNVYPPNIPDSNRDNVQDNFVVLPAPAPAPTAPLPTPSNPLLPPPPTATNPIGFAPNIQQGPSGDGSASMPPPSYDEIQKFN